MRGRGIAVVPMPETGTFGGGPLEVRAREREVALAVLEAVAPLLGELRVVVDGEQFRVTGRADPRTRMSAQASPSSTA